MGYVPLASTSRGLDAQPKLGPPAYVVLGMVGLGARSGYEIKQTVELSIRFFWTISQAQIYPSLEQLERAGLIAGRSQPQGKRRRRVYEITEAGEAVLAQWLCSEEPIPFELRDVAMVKLFFADALSREQALALLVRVRQRSEQQIATLEQIEPAAQLAEREGSAHPLLTLHMGIAFHRAMIDVCEEFEPKLRSKGRG
jgi:PadR family transcriptional regulator, regulatory protein AphA